MSSDPFADFPLVSECCVGTELSVPPSKRLSVESVSRVLEWAL